jgi:hypothetical protein
VGSTNFLGGERVSDLVARSRATTIECNPSGEVALDQRRRSQVVARRCVRTQFQGVNIAPPSLTGAGKTKPKNFGNKYASNKTEFCNTFPPKADSDLGANEGMCLGRHNCCARGSEASALGKTEELNLSKNESV